METPPSIMKIQSLKYNSTPNQQPIFFNNNTSTSTTTSAMETPKLHNSIPTPAASTPNLGHNNNSMIPIDISFSSYIKPPLLDDSEISIFDAQKYFNESNPDSKITRSSSSFSPKQTSTNKNTSLDDHMNISRLSVDGYNRARSFRATPTASSEASWNSQTGLLSNPPGALAVSLRNLPSNKSDTTHGESKRGRGLSNSTNNGGTRWFFRRKCPCSGKKSVQVEELVVVSESKMMSQMASPATSYTKQQIPPVPHQNKIDLGQGGQVQEMITEISNRQQRLSSSSSVHQNHFPTTRLLQQHRVSATSGRPLNDGPAAAFSFPILHNTTSLTNEQSTVVEDLPRDSLEVFQPVDEQSLPRKSGGRGFGFPGSPISRLNATDDDMASDASSDLFEIESFSTQTTSYPMYRRRDSLDEAQNFLAARRLSASNIYCSRRSMDEQMTPSIAATECYEPSEASIDWSVTTAEGFDRSSVTNFSISASEIDDVAIGRHAWLLNNGGGGEVMSRKKGNGGGLLMSCRHEKAVSVGPQPVKYVMAGEQGQQGGGGGPGGGKLPLMSTFMHVSSRVGGGAAGGSNSSSNTYNTNTNKPPPLARSHSARLSLAFAA